MVNRRASVHVYDYSRYCTLLSGGGWTLVVAINALSNDHLKEEAVGDECNGNNRCVTYRRNSILTTRKLSDEVIRKLAAEEGKHICFTKMCVDL